MFKRVAIACIHRLGADQIGARIRQLNASDKGIAAVEFAMVLPVMILMYLGMTELTFGINTDRKLTILSRSLADLTSRSPTMTSAEMDSVFAAAASVMAPFKADEAKMVISSVVVTTVGAGPAVEGKVAWSCAKGTGATKRPANSAYTPPDGFKNANTSFILAEVAMPYAPMFGYAFTGTIDLNETTPWPVRNVQQVTWQGAAC